MKKSQIAIHGSYFGLNFGDTLILSIIKNWVKEYSPDYEINLPFVSSDKEARQIMNQNESEKDGSLENSSGLIFGPGGYFGEPNSTFLRRQYWYWRNYRRHLAWNKRLNNKPYMIVGVGVGPINNVFFRRKVVKLFKGAHSIAVRDSISKDFLITWGISSSRIEVTRDVALTQERTKPMRITLKKKIGLHFSGTELSRYGKLEDFFQFILFIKEKYHLYIVEDEPKQAQKLEVGSIYKYIKDKGINLPVIDYHTPEKLLQDLQDFEGLITSKLHVGILGYSFQIPTLSIPKHQKTKRFFSQINRQEYCLDFQVINKDLLIQKLESCLGSPIKENILKEEAERNKNLVFDFLKNLE